MEQIDNRIVRRHLERHRLGQNPLAYVAKGSGRHHLHVGTQQVLQIQPKRDQVEERARGLEFHEKVDVAVFMVYPSRHRSENANIPRAMPAGYI